VTSSVLTPEQKRHFLALEAETPCRILNFRGAGRANRRRYLRYVEGHAPYKPRYVLPDYERFLANGSAWLELEGAQDLDDAYRC
jgi:hypothetical protein